MRAVACLLVVGAACLAVGCGGAPQQDAPPRAGLAKDEIAWVARYSAWTDELAGHLGRAEEARGGVLGDPEGFAQYRDVAAPLLRCGEEVAATVGAPPSGRLDAVYAGARRLCRTIERGVGRLAVATDPARRTGPFLAAGQAVDRAFLQWSENDTLLDRLLLSRRPLQRLGGDVPESRIEPRLTAVAARVADGRSVEVRCWSAADWRAVLAEEEAATNGALTLDSVGAFAIISTGTLHLQQAHCAPLGRLARGAALPLAGPERDEMSYALGLFSHEIQHIVSPASEAETECAALQHTAEVARQLGVRGSEARAIARRNWEVEYPTLPAKYRSPECQPGGALDQSPDTPDWPTG